MLEVRNLRMRFGGLLAIDDVSLDARRGQITSVIGPNGAGKTTLFNCVTGFYRPTAGTIQLHHDSGIRFPLHSMRVQQVAAKAKVVRSFQNIRLFAQMSVLENLLVAQHNQMMPSLARGLAQIGFLSPMRHVERKAIDNARFWLDRLGLLDRADDQAGDLPYGDQRRLEIIRALCADPVLLCLDEPAAGLNPSESDALNNLLLLIRDQGISLLLIEHDMSVVMRISDHIVVLDHGRKIAQGDPASVRANPAVMAAYLGEEIPEDAAC